MYNEWELCIELHRYSILKLDYVVLVSSINMFAYIHTYFGCPNVHPKANLIESGCQDATSKEISLVHRILNVLPNVLDLYMKCIQGTH